MSSNPTFLSMLALQGFIDPCLHAGVTSASRHAFQRLNLEVKAFLDQG